jgi:hypothetical protein
LGRFVHSAVVSLKLAFLDRIANTARNLVEIVAEDNLQMMVSWRF